VFLFIGFKVYEIDNVSEFHLHPLIIKVVREVKRVGG